MIDHPTNKTNLTEFPKETTFKYPWRKYQSRILGELQNHLGDKHLHVIAPPGSGKTILGLEVALQLNKPTLILTPSIAIRNQWIQRFCDLFLQVDNVPDWISYDIRNPKFLTVVTYQGMHAACNDIKDDESSTEEEESDKVKKSKSADKKLNQIVSGLKAKKIQTIVVDEAHHLKNEWWQTLSKIKTHIDPVIVGLTATPPYDVTLNEWQRYIQLNGPVDAEISVPELVIEGDLCPHQDYLYFNLPTETEHKKILAFRTKSEHIFNEIRTDKVLIEAFEAHPVWKNPLENLEWIYNNLSFYSATIIFLNANKRIIPETHLEVVGDKKMKVPNLDYTWFETVLHFYLFSENEHFVNSEHQRKLELLLRQNGLIERKQINFSKNQSVESSLTSSIGKLESIQEITDFEYQELGNDLRMVILCDYIRKEYFVSTSENTLEINRLGVVPVFEKLRRQNSNHKKIGILTGSLIIIPTSASDVFLRCASKYGVEGIDSSPLTYDSSFVQITYNERIKNHIVHITTEIFQQGEIEILIGTKSLLGEGWDAPAINSLVLASFVGSFVLSNQMRGRAIRTQKDNPGKTGNIWHLATIDPSIKSGGTDIELLKRRFKSFVGVSIKDEPYIENGIGRLDLPSDFSSKEIIHLKNKELLKFASDREELKKRWKSALENGAILIEEIKIPFPNEKDYRTVQTIHLRKTIASLIASLGFSVLIYLESIVQGFARASRHLKTLQDLYLLLTVIGVGGVLLFGRMTYKTLRLYINYRDISKDIQKIGESLLRTLIQTKVFTSDVAKLKVESSKNRWGEVFCHLEGGTTFEKSTFIQLLQEIVNPVDNPRYIIERRSKLGLVFKQIDYHSVPETIGRAKTNAEYFAEQWRTLVGSCNLIYTRTVSGRKLLLKSRIKSLSAQLSDKEIEHINKWR